MSANECATKRRMIKAFACSSKEYSCEICGGHVAQRHRGVVACNACAAFFRRSLELRKAYKCNFRGSCIIHNVGSSRLLCKYCRLQKCLNVGMLTDEVSAGAVKCAGPLEHLTRCWKSRIYDAAVFTKKILGPFWGNAEDMNDKDRAYYGIAMCVFVEPHVLYNFAQSSGIFDALTSEQCKSALVQQCMMTWGFYIMVVNTVRSKGHLATPNRISCCTWDGAILPNDREWAREFYTQLRVRTVEAAVDGLMNMSKDFITTCRVFSACRFDDTEKAVFAFILLLKCAPLDLFDEAARDAALHKLFCELHAYEEAKGNDYALRVGELMLFLQEFEKTCSAWEHFRVLLCTFGCEEPQPDSPQPVQDYASLLYQKWKMARAQSPETNEY